MDTQLKQKFGIIGLTTGIFVLDLLTPLGIAEGVLYILVIFATLPLKDKHFTVIMGSITLGLVLIGYYLSPEGSEYWKVIINRTISVGAIGTTVLLVLSQMKVVRDLAKSEKRFDLAIQGTVEGIWDWPDITQNQQWWSPQFYTLLGLNQEEFPPSQPQFHSLLHPNDRQEFIQAINVLISEQTPFDREFRLRTQTGEYRWFRGRSIAARSTPDSPIRVVGSIDDITERKLHHEKMRLFIEAAPCGMLMIDHAGVIQMTNQQITQQFGYEQSELIGQPVEILVPPRFRENHPELRNTYLAAPNPRQMGLGRNLYGLRKDETEFPVEIGQNPVTLEEHPFILTSIIDVTEQTKAEAELRQYTRELEISNRDLDDFAYITSHDLKEPLRGIANYSRFLIEDHGSILPEEGKEQCHTIIRLAQRMEKLIETLRHFSRLGRTDLAWTPINLENVFTDIAATLKPRLEETNTALRWTPPLPTWPGDAVRPQEAFANVITNAMKYNDKPEKWIEITTRSLHNPKRLEIAIQDNGIGIPEKHQQDIFEFFAGYMAGKNLAEVMELD